MLNIIVLLGCIYLIDQLDLSHPYVIPGLYAFFTFTYGIIFLLHRFTKASIEKHNDTSEVVIPRDAEDDGPEEEKATVKQYDMNRLKRLRRGLVEGALITGAMHYFSGSVHPIAIHSLMLLFRTIKEPLFHVHTFGRKCERPFDAKKGWLGGLFGKKGKTGAGDTDKNEDKDKWE